MELRSGGKRGTGDEALLAIEGQYIAEVGWRKSLILSPIFPLKIILNYG